MMKIKASVVYEQCLASDKRISVFQGGTRSGKTYNILIYWITRLLIEEGKTLTICRLTLPALKGSVMRDFFEILDKMEIYDASSHNKTENTYMLNGNLIEFISIDQPQKIRGRKRNYLFVNEANELPFEGWQQLVFRTTDKIIIDYNPSDEFHWIYDKVLTRDDHDFSMSTYLDNPFLPKEIINEIERLKEQDENYWRVYGLGERAVSQATIYSNFKQIDNLPTGESCYGLDFGFNHPSALVKVVFFDDNIYAQEMVYKSGLTTPDLIQTMHKMGIPNNVPIYCDHSRPEAIEELIREGFDCYPANKSVIDGINFIKGQNPTKEDGVRKFKGRQLFVTKDSVNGIKELRSYKWRENKNGEILDEPVKFNDDFCDALRYGAYTHYKKLSNQIDYESLTYL